MVKLSPAPRERAWYSVRTRGATNRPDPGRAGSEPSSSLTCSDKMIGHRAVLAAVVVAACLASRASAEGTATAGRACSDTNDCYDSKACLGGRCCTFSQSQYTSAGTQWANEGQCTSCADSSAANPGRCEQCATGYGIFDRNSVTQVDGTVVLYPDMQSSGACYELCGAGEYIDADMGLNCRSKLEAGSSCLSYGDVKDEFCLSGLCGGTYCCNQAAADAGCTNPCDNMGDCSNKASQGGECSDTNDCYDSKACLGGRCCTFSQSQYTSAGTQWANEGQCTSCADSSAANPGRCEQCATGYGIFDRNSVTQVDGTVVLYPDMQSSGACYELCGAGEYIDADMGLNCRSKLEAGSSCLSYGDVKDEFCLSGLCGGTYCCNQAAADAGCTNPCDNMGDCSNKASQGGECSDTNDCYDSKACLGGRCCTFSQSQYTSAGTQWANEGQCTSCADSSAANPGRCEQCATGYGIFDRNSVTQVDGTVVLYPDMQSSGACYELCGAGEYIDADMGLNCRSKLEAGSSCLSYGDVKDEFCLSGLCGGTYCCNQAAADAGCTNPCDNMGDCSNKASQGGECSDTNDCYDSKACLGGRCCTFSQSQYTSAGTQWANEGQCTSCADSSAANPGRCEQCATGYGIFDRNSVTQVDGTVVLYRTCNHQARATSYAVLASTLTLTWV